MWIKCKLGTYAKMAKVQVGDPLESFVNTVLATYNVKKVCSPFLSSLLLSLFLFPSLSVFLLLVPHAAVHFGLLKKVSPLRFSPFSLLRLHSSFGLSQSTVPITRGSVNNEAKHSLTLSPIRCLPSSPHVQL